MILKHKVHLRVLVNSNLKIDIPFGYVPLKRFSLEQITLFEDGVINIKASTEDGKVITEPLALSFFHDEPNQRNTITDLNLLFNVLDESVPTCTAMSLSRPDLLSPKKPRTLH